MVCFLIRCNLSPYLLLPLKCPFPKKKKKILVVISLLPVSPLSPSSHPGYCCHHICLKYYLIGSVGCSRISGSSLFLLSVSVLNPLLILYGLFSLLPGLHLRLSLYVLCPPEACCVCAIHCAFPVLQGLLLFFHSCPRQSNLCMTDFGFGFLNTNLIMSLPC